METYDLVVVGAGPGGYPAAIRAAQLGAKTAIVEREELGGTCLNWGCIPTKALIASAEAYHKVRTAGSMGIKVDGASPDYPAMAKRKDEVVGKLRGGVETLLKANGVRIIRGEASFKERGKLAIDGKGAKAICAEKVILASGTVAARPKVIPMHKRVLDNRTVLALTELPSSMLILGAGVIGCEFACYLARLGVAVTMVEMLDDIVTPIDPDVRAVLRRHMEKQLKIRIFTGETIKDVKADASSVTARAGGEKITADYLLVAAGRRPETAPLNLKNADVRLADNGFIEVDRFGRTSASTIYAVGDVTGGFQLAHEATSQGLTAAANALGKHPRKNETLIPSCIFTSPEMAAVGLGEQEAKEKGREVASGKFLFAAIGKALASGEAEGFVKWVADPATGRLLGASAVGPHATELIAEAAVAVRAELTAEELARTIHCHPTLGEVWMEAAHALVGEPVHGVPRKKR